MVKTSFVKSVAFSKEWQGPNGVIYYFNVEFINGDKGQYGSKSQNQTSFVEGCEVTYEIQPGNLQNTWKITIPRNQGQPNTGQRSANTRSRDSKSYTPEEYKYRQLVIIAEFSIRLASEMFIAGKIEDKSIEPMADRIMGKVFDMAAKHSDKYIVPGEKPTEQ